MKQIGNIGNIFITVEYENEDVCVILDNRDEKAESISIFYEESHKPGEQPLEYFKPPRDRPEKVRLPKGFEEWAKLCFRVEVDNRVRPINGSISNTLLKEWSDEAKRQIKDDSPQPKTEPLIPGSEPTRPSVKTIDKDLKPDVETTNVPEQRAIDYQHKANIIVQEARERIAELVRTYKDGETIDFLSIENPTAGQTVWLILNWIARTIEDWVVELEQSGTANPDLIQTLGFANQTVKDKLKEVRGAAPPLPEPLNPDTDVSTDTAYNELQNKCTVYVARYEGLLVGYQLGCQIAEAEYNQFIPQFIKDRLFNSIARFLSVEQFPDRLDQCLQLIGYEVVPIEIGKTQADARTHDIQASRQTGVDPGTIVEVVLPGLQRKVDGEIIQKPVVIRGE